jgi:hypothetical protein
MATGVQRENHPLMGRSSEQTAAECRLGCQAVTPVNGAFLFYFFVFFVHKGHLGIMVLPPTTPSLESR